MGALISDLARHAENKLPHSEWGPADITLFSKSVKSLAAISGAPRNLPAMQRGGPEQDRRFSCGRFELARYFRVSYRLNGSCCGLMDPELIPANSKRPPIGSGMKARTRFPKPIEHGSINFRLGATRRKQVAPFGVGPADITLFSKSAKSLAAISGVLRAGLQSVETVITPRPRCLAA